MKVLTQERVDAYAEASGDRNPIHVDAEFAASTPFEGTIAHGMLVLALLGQMMHDAYGDAWLRSGSMKVRFKAPTRPGDEVTAVAEVARAEPKRAEYAIRCANQAGDVLIEGRASVVAAT